MEVKALVLSRVYCEEFAKDSMENVIFLICRFFEITGTYPQKISIVGFEFKRSRFIENHLTALRFPIANIKYIGNAPEPPREREVEYFKDLNDSEYKFAVKYFEADWYGINPPLSTKKATRNPHSTEHTYQLSNPKFKDFFKEIEQVSLNEVIQSKLPSWK